MKRFIDKISKKDSAWYRWIRDKFSFIGLNFTKWTGAGSTWTRLYIDNDNLQIWTPFIAFGINTDNYYYNGGFKPMLHTERKLKETYKIGGSNEKV